MASDRVTREELEVLMQENLERVSRLVDDRVAEALQRSETSDYTDFQAFRRNYKVYNATTVPVLPRGTMIVIDTRPTLGASGTVAKYVSLGDRYVEEWAKQVNP